MSSKVVQSESGGYPIMESSEPAVDLTPGQGLVRVSVVVDRPIDDVWAALTDPDAVAQWLGTMPRLRPGGTARLDFGDGDFFTLHVDRFEPPSVLQYAWRFLGIGPEDRIAWRLVPRDSGCLVTVTDREPERASGDLAELGRGWADFLGRLERFLRTGERSRYDWRSEVDASIELESPPDVAYEALFAYGVDGWCTAVAGPLLAPGVELRLVDDRGSSTSAIVDVEWTPPIGVRLRIGGAGWGRPTTCDLRLRRRSSGALLLLHHDGWRALDLPDGERRTLRVRFASMWIDTLARAAEVVEHSRDAMPIADPPMGLFWPSEEERKSLR